MKPVCLRPYPVQRVHKDIFIKDVEGVVRLGVLEEENDSKWGAPLFAQTKAKTNHVRFLSNFLSLNSKLKRNPYPMPTIREILLNIEGFKYASLINLNMSYYQISLN